MSVLNPMCYQCKHKRGQGCLAFPDGIPTMILDGEYDHRRAFPGDGGIRFEAKNAERWERSFERMLMDGELEGMERMPQVFALRAAEVQAAVQKRETAAKSR